MRRVRTPVVDVDVVLQLQLRADLQQAAGSNTLLSRTEQSSAMPHIQQAADEIRASGGSGARVTVDALEQNLMDKARRLIGDVNQNSGSGAGFLSKTEANAAFKQSPRIGEAVLRAYEVASGNGLAVDELAENRVTRDLNDPDVVFMRFATQSEAENYQHPDGKHVRWLVKTNDSLLKASYVRGSNDLWVETFDIDRLNGAVTVTGEH